MTISEIYARFRLCNGIETDSRKILPGQMFLALKGDNFDGNKYVQSAFDKGAAFAIVESSCPLAGNPAFADRLAVVEDARKALWELASWHREHLRPGKAVSASDRLVVLSLTGTNGKTTTKELVNAVLSSKYKVAATKGNLNNNIGVPLTLLSIEEGTDIAIVEMGASHPGDIDELTAIAHPDYGLITNVGKAHILGFGSFEGVKATKGELYDYVHGSGTDTVFVNADDNLLCEMASARTGMKTIPYGVAYQAVNLVTPDSGHPFLRMVLASGIEINTRLVGSYNAANVLAALAVGAYFGVDAGEAAKAISAYEPSNNRSMMLKTERNTLIVDAYNANPSSMDVALDNFFSMDAPDKIVLLGSMGELGVESEPEHRRIAQKALSAKKVRTFFVGPGFADVVEGKVFASSAELAEFLAGKNVTGATILIKGSRSMQMEKVLEVL